MWFNIKADGPKKLVGEQLLTGNIAGATCSRNFDIIGKLLMLLQH